MRFKDQFSLQDRSSESRKIIKKYPTKIPIICENNGKSLPDIDKKKFLVPKELSLAQFMYIIRKRIKVSPEKSIFLMINNNLIPSAKLISEIYQEHSDEDGFLYVFYDGESTFG